MSVEARAQLPLAGSVLAFPFIPFKCTSDRVEQFLFRRALLQEIYRATLRRANCRGNVAMAGEEQESRLAGTGARFARGVSESRAHRVPNRRGSQEYRVALNRNIMRRCSHPQRHTVREAIRFPDAQVMPLRHIESRVWQRIRIVLRSSKYVQFVHRQFRVVLTLA